VFELNKIKVSWDSKLGLLLLALFFCSAYYTIIKGIIKETFSIENPYLLNLLIPILGVLIIYTVWAFKSHRLSLNKKGKITIGVFLNTDDENVSATVKSVFDSSIVDIKDRFDFIKLKLYPINFVLNERKLGEYLVKNSHSLDCAILAKVINGNELKENSTQEKIVINNIAFSGRFDVKKDLRLFKNNINLTKDLSLRSYNKNWEYIVNNSLNDKIKIKTNLTDIILFYAGLYLIYMKEFDDSLEVFKLLKNNQNKSEDKSIQIINARLNNILIELFLKTSRDYYTEKKDCKKAYELLEECQAYFPFEHPYYFPHQIDLARLAYENGNLTKAILYSSRAEKKQSNSVFIIINKAFFALINNDIHNTAKYYNELAYRHKYEEYNFVDTIEFLEREKYKFPQSSVLFEFAIAVLNYCYVDKPLGISILNELKTQTLNEDYKLIHDLIIGFLEKGENKSSYFHRNKKKRKGKK